MTINPALETAKNNYLPNLSEILSIPHLQVTNKSAFLKFPVLLKFSAPKTKKVQKKMLCHIPEMFKINIILISQTIINLNYFSN